MADAYYLPLALHNPNGPVATAMTAQVAASIPNFLIMETVGGTGIEKERHEAMVQETLKIHDRVFLNCQHARGWVWNSTMKISKSTPSSSVMHGVKGKPNLGLCQVLGMYLGNTVVVMQISGTSQMTSKRSEDPR